ncbi:hypothetical protein Cch01nite_35750 [Cellulomonas chitinilytica]|uniref:Uncharacterized protein n=1 Tax=Cellulomonas chitinilytica TaxID=398759 RepID=A0A919U312_9CELL|nr:hypothetical protein [Cellulomonas chitinilytica]GIG22851.1 hypothetical protein Cch01nite_35750 [Cellulomonas chitinilytica]
MTETRTIRAMVVADVVLVLTFLVLLVLYVAGGSSGDGGDAQVSASPTSSAPAATAGATTGPASFRLPSGNIACAMADEGVTCTIASYSYAQPVVAGCTGTTGHVLVLDADGAAFTCETGPTPQVAGDDVATLEYGSSATAGDYTCTSATDGVTCTNGAGVGFRLARASWTELP